MEPLMTSRTKPRATEISPFNKHCAASSRREVANAGSRRTRSSKISSTGRVRGALLMVLRSFALFVVGPAALRIRDVALLPPLRTAAEQQDKPVAVLGEVQPVARPPVDPPFGNTATNRLHVAEVAFLHAQQNDADLSSGLPVEIG